VDLHRQPPPLLLRRYLTAAVRRFTFMIADDLFAVFAGQSSVIMVRAGNNLPGRDAVVSY
jgi:hypothetical protein